VSYKKNTISFIKKRVYLINYQCIMNPGIWKSFQGRNPKQLCLLYCLNPFFNSAECHVLLYGSIFHHQLFKWLKEL
jgi:hypothetical protein